MGIVWLTKIVRTTEQWRWVVFSDESAGWWLIMVREYYSASGKTLV